jgi:urease accessory protein
LALRAATLSSDVPVSAVGLPAAGWKAELALEYQRQGDRTVLAKRRHDGPLVVQKPLYPEGGEVCHTIVVHPPGGIAGGDDLMVSASVAEGAAALLTTPGAAKWYRSAGPWAGQRIFFAVAGALEWVPQETIVHGSLARMQTDPPRSRRSYLGWSSLPWPYRLWRAPRVEDAGDPPLARGRVDLERTGGSKAAASLGVLPVCSEPRNAARHGAEHRERVLARAGRGPESGESAVTRLPGVLIARYLGDSSEAAKTYFRRLWSVLRPALVGRDAAEPRIWRT